MNGLSARQQLIAKFYADRPLAHETLFAHRRPYRTPAFHAEIVTDWHSDHPRVLDLVFRNGAKSTIAEEAVCLQAGFREFKNALFVGSNKDRAMERLHSVRHEVESNDLFRKVFGDLVGPTWADDELVFSNGRRILALGRGQSLRGTKWEDIRPDLIFADDIEEREEVWTKTGRAKVFFWFTRDLIPAGDVNVRVRVAGTPLDPDALMMRLKRDAHWLTHTYPIYYLNDEGEKTSSWPDRWPIDRVIALEDSFRRSGDISGFNAEYLCMAESPESKRFKEDMFRIEPRVRSWQAAYSMTDPARTVGPVAATTGHAVWSWIGPKLVVWDAWAERLMPNEIINRLFDTYEHHHPVWLGFEEDGLNQWAMQPIRQEQVRRGQAIPVKAMKAPKGKFDFIEGLQPFFFAREVEFAKPLPDLKAQFLGYPSGEIDAPNALAYALKMRPGAPIYDGFRGSHVAQDIAPAQGRPLWLCLNATASLLTGVVLQVFDGSVRIYGDAILEGEPGANLAALLVTVQSDFGRRDVQLAAGPIHFDRYNNVGLVAAATRIPREVRNGVAASYGRSWIEGALQTERKGLPQIMISENAEWTLNAFAGGYSRALQKGGILADYAEEGPYRILVEGLESFCGLLDLGLDEEGGRARFNAETAQGRPYRSMLASDQTVRASKSDWNTLLKG